MSLLELYNINKLFEVRHAFSGGRLHSVQALRDINLKVEAFKTLGVVGESGSGKTTLAKVMLKLLVPSSGDIIYDTAAIENFRKDCQIIFQNPYNSLNPRMRIIDAIAEPLIIHRIVRRNKLKDRVIELLDLTGIAHDALYRFPREFSGGERQRICIARALACEAKFLVLDEPISSLDLIMQARLIDLFLELKERLKLTYVFISHNLAVVRKIADYLVVMRSGSIVEQGHCCQVIGNPTDDYTRSLIEAARG